MQFRRENPGEPVWPLGCAASQGGTLLGEDDGSLTFRVLGPFQVLAGRTPVAVGGPRLRALLARLLVHPGHTVSVATLVTEFWPDTVPPPDAERTIRTYVSRLRGALSPYIGAEGLLVTSAPGYLVRAGVWAVDAGCFEESMAAGRRALAGHRFGEAARQLAEALALWRGDAFAEFAGYPALAAAGARLDRLRTTAVEDRVAADLAAGGSADLIIELEGLVRAHPERERLRGHLMIALYRMNRQAEALAVFRDARAVLIEEHGIEPSLHLTEIHQRILAQDPALATGPVLPGSAVPPTVSVAPATPAGPADNPGRPRPAQLPAMVPGFAGRDPELALLGAALPTGDGAAVAPLVLSGPAGVGKTTLAVHWAHQIGSAFPDGQLFVNLRGFEPDRTAALDAATAARTFLDALGVAPARIPGDPDALFGLYRSLLSGRRLLIVLDNARDVEHVRPLLPGSPGCLAVVTSRNRLTGLLAADGARPLLLDVLPAGPAREILRRRLGAERLAGEPEAVTAIVARCGGLPLALAIAAARAALHPGFPLAGLAAQLREDGTLLDALRGDDDPATDLRTVFSWSYRALSPDAAALFRLLGLTAGPDVDATGAACLSGRRHDLARAALRELAEASLVTETRPGRYTLHDLLHAFARDLAAATDTPRQRVAALTRLLDHYLHTSYTAEMSIHPPFSTISRPARMPGTLRCELDSPTAAQDWFDRERAALLAAVPLAVRHGLDGYAWRLAWALSRDLDRSGRWTDRLAVQQIALAAAIRAGDQAGQAHCLRDLGMAFFRLGQAKRADEHLHRALALFGDTGDLSGAAHTHVNLSQLTESQGELQAALSHARQAGARFRLAGNQVGRAYALNMVGWKLALLGDHEQAIVHCEQALALLTAGGDAQGQADTWDSLGYAHHHLGRYQRAVDCYLRAISLFEQVGDRYGRAGTDINLAATFQAAGDRPAALEVLHRALVTLQEIGHPDAARVQADLQRLTAAVPGRNVAETDVQDEPAGPGRSRDHRSCR